jgi:hypothetical protein
MADDDPSRHGSNFGILLATIAIGLLIAVGLEQSVEALHRVHERHRLEQDLLAETRQNLAIISRNSRYLEMTRPWLIEVRKAVEGVRAGGKSPPRPYPPTPNRQTLDSPQAASWNVAQATGETALLPRDEARMYDFLYRQQSALKVQTHACADVLDALRRFETQFMIRRATGVFATPEKTAKQVADLTHGSLYFDAPVPGMTGMTSEDLRQYSVLLGEALSELERLQPDTNSVYQWTRAATLGAKSEDQLRSVMPAANLTTETAPGDSAAH